MSDTYSEPTAEQNGLIGRLMRFCLTNKLVVLLFVLLVVGWGLMVAPFDWNLGSLPRNPVPTDAIPDTGENQQIVFTEWMGRSPQDVEDQITYPLTVSLLGVRGVKSIRSSSMFGFSSIYVIFKEKVAFDESRWAILEKLNSLPAGSLPEGVQPTLGPDATALGQVFWYTLEGRDADGNPAGGWDLEELRTIQDWYVRYALLSADGVSEVASIGGYMREYQVDVDPAAMRAYNVTLPEVVAAVKASNLDVGAKTMELNRVEYFIRGIGFIKKVSDIENSVIKVTRNVPIRVKDVAVVVLGPAMRRGALDKDGAEAVGGVVVARFGENPLATIKNVQKKIVQITPGLPRKTLANGTVSQVTVVPFYDRTKLIYETLGTLKHALSQEIMITLIVVILMVMHLRSSMLIGSMLPLAVLLCFVAMKMFGVDANIVALSGIAIAIGTIVDMGIVVCENILRHLDKAPPNASRLEIVHRAASEVGSAILTAVATTVISFLPVFAMIGAEGKLFKPLAFTKTFALIASIIIALTVIPTAAYILFRRRSPKRKRFPWIGNVLIVVLVWILLSRYWEPLGPERGSIRNLIFVGGMVGLLLGFFWLFRLVYAPLLRFFLRYKALFLLLPVLLLILGVKIWMGLSREFMPSLDEGSFLYMPTTMPHASIGEALDILAKQDMAFRAIPEVESAVGKLGRAETPLDPAPISMIETVINYKPEYKTGKDGRRLTFRYDAETGKFTRDENGNLIPDANGRTFRQWREQIKTPNDIWREIVSAGHVPGTTSAPKLQPIETRRIMLQTGMRAPMGVKIKGSKLQEIEQAGLQLEKLLKEVPSVEPSAVSADRIVAKPYLEIVPDREAMARYGVRMQAFQNIVEVAVGGKTVTTTVEGRERFPVRVRYQRELRDRIESLGRILIPGKGGAQIPLEQIAEIRYVSGPQVIKSEDTFLVGYVLFDMKPGYAEVEVVEECRQYFDAKLASGELVLPAGVSFDFAGMYENQVRARKTLIVVLPLALFLIFMILYFQFKSVPTTVLVFSGIFVAWAGGFIFLWLYGRPWFLDFSIFGRHMRELFQVHPIHLSVAVWVGFLALFGIASDNGVIQSTYLDQIFRETKPDSIEAIREATLVAAQRRLRPCLMTSATTILALLPVLTATGRGADEMVHMAIPSFGGMLVVLISIFVVPVLYCATKEIQLWFSRPQSP